MQTNVLIGSLRSLIKSKPDGWEEEALHELELMSKHTEQPVECLDAFEEFCGKRFAIHDHQLDPASMSYDVQKVALKQAYYACFKAGYNARPKREIVEDGLRAEIAALQAVKEAAFNLLNTMDEVSNEITGVQSDRVFAYYEFDQLRYAFTLVDALKGAANAKG
jgi:hypothetical protein